MSESDLDQQGSPEFEYEYNGPTLGWQKAYIINETTTTIDLDFYVSPTGSDSNPGTSTLFPFLTLQKAVDAAAQYDYQGLYVPRVHVADGVFANTTVKLPPLINGIGGYITGDVVTPTNVTLNDNGSDYTFKALPNSNWYVQGFKLNGTYGAFYVDRFAQLGIGSITYAGNFSQAVIDVVALGWLIGATFPSVDTFTVTATSWPGGFIFSRGTIVADNWSVTFSNAISMAWLISLDFASSGFAAAGMTFTNGANVTCTSFCIGLFNGAYFEVDSAGSTKVDGVTLSRANAPGFAAGFLIDTTRSYFGPDYTTNSAVAYTGLPLIDAAGSLRADYNFTTASTWTFRYPSGGAFVIEAPGGGTNSALTLDSTANGGASWIITSVAGAPNLVNFVELVGPNFPSPLAMSPTAITTANGNVIGWGGTAYQAGAPDTAFSRFAANVVVLGNGTPGDFSGTFVATSLFGQNSGVIGFGDAGFSRLATGVIALGNAAAGNASGTLVATALYSNQATAIAHSSATITGGGTGNVPTLNAGPVTGDPTKWLPYDDNGVTRYIPSW